MIRITEKLIPKNNKCRPGTVRKKQWIVIHETANTSKGAGAENHAKYLANLAAENKTYLSWHYTVDDKNIIRHIPDNEIAWHAGDGEKEGGGNMAGIGVEICVNPESDYSKALDNAAELTAVLLKNNGLTLASVRQHHEFSSYGKNCPQRMRDNGLWNTFLEKVSAYFKDASRPSDSQKSTLEFKVGDKVVLNGNVYTDSYASKAGRKFTYKVCTVTKVTDSSRKAPYLLDNGLGWAREQDISRYGAAAKQLSVGVKVHVSGNLYTTSYGEKPVRAVDGNFTVSKIIEGRKAGVLLNGNYGWVEKSSCRII